MRIAQIAPASLPVPPKGYGGTELVVSLLTEGLVERGHEVTLFASGDSSTEAELVSYYPDAPGTDAVLSDPLVELPHVLHAYAHAAGFDVIHDHTTPLGPAIGAQLADPPVVHTLHSPPWSPRTKPVYDLVARRIRFVAISRAQQEQMPELDYSGVVHHGLDLDAYTFRAEKEDFLLFLGRASGEKGAHLAIQAARTVGRPLVMALKIAEPEEEEFFDSTIAPMLGDDVEVIRELSHERKVDLFGRAACTLMPIRWPEPFGLVMVESMACGTPVVAFPEGAAPEIVEHEVTGFLAHDDDELAAYAARSGEIDPAACRERVERRFSVGAMLDGYERIFAEIGGAARRGPRS